MKYIFLFLLSLPALGEDQVQLILGYQSNSKFTITTETTSNTSMQFDGNKELLPEELKAQFPMEVLGSGLISQIITTGANEADGSYLVDMHIDQQRNQMSINGLDRRIPPGKLEGATVLGKAWPGGHLEYSSMNGPNVDGELESIMKTVFLQLGSSNQLAERTVKLGETTSVQMPMSFPIGGGKAANFDMKMDYKLNSIEGDIANFDVRFSALVNAALEASSINIIGSGTGTITYDIVNQYSPEVNSTMELKLTAPLHGGTLINSSISKTKVSTTYNSR